MWQVTNESASALIVDEPVNNSRNLRQHSLQPGEWCTLEDCGPLTKALQRKQLVSCAKVTEADIAKLTKKERKAQELRQIRLLKVKVASGKLPADVLPPEYQPDSKEAKRAAREARKAAKAAEEAAKKRAEEEAKANSESNE